MWKEEEGGERRRTWRVRYHRALQSRCLMHDACSWPFIDVILYFGVFECFLIGSLYGYEVVILVPLCYWWHFYFVFSVQNMQALLAKWHHVGVDGWNNSTLVCSRLIYGWQSYGVKYQLSQLNTLKLPYVALDQMELRVCRRLCHCLVLHPVCMMVLSVMDCLVPFVAQLWKSIFVFHTAVCLNDFFFATPSFASTDLPFPLQVSMDCTRLWLGWPFDDWYRKGVLWSGQDQLSLEGRKREGRHRQ